MTPVCSVQPRNYTERKSGQERSAGRPGPQRVEWNSGETNDLSGSVAIVAAAARDVPRSVPLRRSQPFREAKLFGAVGQGRPQHENAPPLILQADVEVNAVGPPIHVAFGAQVAGGPVVVISFPAFFKSNDIGR